MRAIAKRKDMVFIKEYLSLSLNMIYRIGIYINASAIM